MPTFSLADIQKAADEKYGPLVIPDVPGGPVELVNPLRLSKEKRKKLTELDKATDSGEIDVDEKIAQVIRLAAKPADAKRLLAAVGGDLAQLKEIVERWTESSQVGEASPSPS